MRLAPVPQEMVLNYVAEHVLGLPRSYGSGVLDKAVAHEDHRRRPARPGPAVLDRGGRAGRPAARRGARAHRRRRHVPHRRAARGPRPRSRRRRSSAATRAPGVVEAVGADVTGVAVGDHVVLSFESCGACEACAGEAPVRLRAVLAAQPARPPRPTSPPAVTDARRRTRSRRAGSASRPSPPTRWPPSATWWWSTRPCRSRSSGRSAAASRPAPAPCCRRRPRRAAGHQHRGVRRRARWAWPRSWAAVVNGATTIIAVDLHQPRLDLAMELGATHTIRGDDPDLLEQVPGDHRRRRRATTRSTPPATPPCPGRDGLRAPRRRRRARRARSSTRPRARHAVGRGQAGDLGARGQRRPARRSSRG